jgi:Tfp pilus assembly protein PilZ
MANRIIAPAARGSAASRTERSRRGRLTESRARVGELAIEILDEAGQAIAFDAFDLSAVGVYIYSDLLLTPGEIVHLRLRLPWTPRPIHVRGEVVRAEADEGGEQSPGMGVAFRDIGTDVEQALRRYVAGRFFRHATTR